MEPEFQVCPVHQVHFRQIPAGVSKKDGKPYNAFWACPQAGCKQRPIPGQAPAPITPTQETSNQGTTARTPMPQTQPPSAPPSSILNMSDMEIRLTLAKKAMSGAKIEEMDAWVEWVKTGKTSLDNIPF